MPIASDLPAAQLWQAGARQSHSVDGDCFGWLRQPRKDRAHVSLRVLRQNGMAICLLRAQTRL
jgi:hypothetical protein